MSRKNIEKYIPQAIKVLNAKFSDGKVPSSYNGYISSFGASIMQSGLSPTLALFENKYASTKEDKSVLIELILSILDEKSQESSLLLYTLQKGKAKEKQLKQQIMDIAVAIKLSIRTFELV